MSDAPEPIAGTLHARCLCGAVQLRAALPSLWMSHCHCRLCRRAHGAAFVTWVGLDASACTLDVKGDALRWYASTPPAQRGFCTQCGGTLFFRSTRWPGELHVTVANVDTPLDRKPDAHAYWDRHVDWYTPDPHDGLPRRTSQDDGGKDGL